MTPIETLEKRIATLEREVATLKGRPISPPSDKPTNIIAYQIAFDAWVAGDRKAMKEYLRHYRIPPVVNAPIHRGHAERPASAGKPTADRHSRAGRG
jgi:hypothetical protein